MFPNVSELSKKLDENNQLLRELLKELRALNQNITTLDAQKLKGKS